MKVAVVQSAAKLGDKEANMRSIARVSKALARLGVDIACFPELVTTGYALYKEWPKYSEEIPGPTTDSLGKTAREHGMHLVVGMPELATRERECYDSAVLIDYSGDVAGVYRKVHLWDKERMYFAPGNRFPVFKTRLGRVGIGICYDLEFPEPARVMALAGASLIFYPSAQPSSMRRRIDVYAKSRAAENCVFVAFSNLAGRDGSLVYLGGSQITSPTCKVLARVGKGVGYAVADVDFRDLERRGSRFRT